MMIVIPIQIDRPQSAIAVSKAKQLQVAFLQTAIETLGAEWLVFSAPDDSIIRCVPRTDLVFPKPDGAAPPVSSILPATS